MKRSCPIAVVLAVAGLLFVQPSTARAADANSNGKPNENKSNEKTTERTMPKNGLTQDLMKVSDEGYDALRAIHVARLAIFNGETKMADKLLDRAKKDLDEATKDAQTFASDLNAADHEKKAGEKSQAEKNNKMEMIPIDGNIAVADTFVGTTDRNKHIEKANEHLKAGQSKQALEELRLGEVDVVFTRVLLPLESTKKRVADAEKLVGEHKYYEANLCLKAAEEGVVVDAIDLVGTPKTEQKQPSTASTATPPKS